MNYDDYKGVHEVLDFLAQAKYKNALVEKFLPLAGLNERLEKETLKVLDVGCGTGYQTSVCGKSVSIISFAKGFFPSFHSGKFGST